MRTLVESEIRTHFQHFKLEKEQGETWHGLCI